MFYLGLKTQVDRLKTKIRNIYDSHNRDKNQLKENLRKELITSFSKQLKRIESKAWIPDLDPQTTFSEIVTHIGQFINEIEYLRQNLHTERNISVRKNIIVYKLCSILKESELTINEFSLKMTKDIDQKLTLNDFWDTGFNVKENRKIMKKESAIQDSLLKVENQKLSQRNHQLELELDTMTELYKDMLDQLQGSNSEVTQLQKEKKSLVDNYEKKLETLSKKYEKDLKRFKQKFILEKDNLED